MSFANAVFDPVHRFLSWWGHELHQIVPPSLRPLLYGSEPRHVLCLDPDGLRLLRENGRHRLELVRGPDTAETWQAIVRASNCREIKLGIRLPLEACLVRRLELPRSAQKDVPRILDLDLERSTPFKQKDVYTAYYIEPGRRPNGRIGVRHLILARLRVDAWLERLAQLGCPAAFVDCWADNQDEAPPVNLLATAQPDRSAHTKHSRLIKIFAAASLALTVSAGIIHADKHARALAQVETNVQQLRLRTEAVRAAQVRSQAPIDRLAQLENLRRSHLSALVVLEELTRALPDSAWLSDFRLDGDTVEIAGVSASAASLLPILERSGIFAEAELTSPVTLVQQEEKERFSIRIRINAEPRRLRSAAEGRNGR